MTIFFVYWLYYWDDENIYDSGYVGITKHIKARIFKHRKKFGKFKFKIIFTGSIEQAYALELHLRPRPNIGLNKATGGLQFGTNGPRKGLITSEEVKEKLRIANTGLKRSKETCEKLKLAKMNISEETRLKISEAGKGRKHTNEVKAKVSEALTGRPVSEETRLKISNSNKGRLHTEEEKLKMRKPKSTQAKINIGLAGLGRVRSEETKIRIANTLKETKRAKRENFALFGSQIALTNHHSIETMALIDAEAPVNKE